MIICRLLLCPGFSSSLRGGPSKVESAHNRHSENLFLRQVFCFSSFWWCFPINTQSAVRTGGRRQNAVKGQHTNNNRPTHNMSCGLELELSTLANHCDFNSKYPPQSNKPPNPVISRHPEGLTRPH